MKGSHGSGFAGGASGLGNKVGICGFGSGNAHEEGSSGSPEMGGWTERVWTRLMLRHLDTASVEACETPTKDLRVLAPALPPAPGRPKAPKEARWMNPLRLLFGPPAELGLRELSLEAYGLAAAEKLRVPLLNEMARGLLAAPLWFEVDATEAARYRPSALAVPCLALEAESPRRMPAGREACSLSADASAEADALADEAASESSKGLRRGAAPAAVEGRVGAAPFVAPPPRPLPAPGPEMVL